MTGNIDAAGYSISNAAVISSTAFTQPPYAFGNATGTITPNISLGSIQSMTLTGNITLNSITNIVSGQSAVLALTQDATGNRLLTSTMKFAGNVRTLSTAASSTDIIAITYIGSTYYASLARGFV